MSEAEELRLNIRINELETITEALPKCWRLNDGGELVQDVAVVPHHIIYVMTDGEIDRYVVRELRKPFSQRHARYAHWLTLVGYPLGSIAALTERHEEPCNCYDSHEAAESALNQG